MTWAYITVNMISCVLRLWPDIIQILRLKYDLIHFVINHSLSQNLSVPNNFTRRKDLGTQHAMILDLDWFLPMILVYDLDHSQKLVISFLLQESSIQKLSSISVHSFFRYPAAQNFGNSAVFRVEIVVWNMKRITLKVITCFRWHAIDRGHFHWHLSICLIWVIL